MVKLTVSPEVSRNGVGDGPTAATAGSGALTTIVVQAGKAKIVLAVLKHQDTWQVRIRHMNPDLTDVGDSLEQAKALRQEHDDLVTKLAAKQREFAAVLTKNTPKSSAGTVEDGESAPAATTQEVTIQSLADAWKDVNKQMEYRRMLLDQSVAFHTSAIQFGHKMDQVEAQCASEVQSSDVDDVRKLMQQHQDLKKSVLEASMATLQEGQLLLERIRKVALCAGVQSRHATTSACHAIERLLQLLQDKWRRLEELWFKRWIQLQQCCQMAQLDQDAIKVKTWLDGVGEAYIGQRELGDSLDSSYALQEECLNIETQYSELPVTMRRLVDTAEYLTHSALPVEGECGAARQRLTALQRRVEDFGKMFSVRRKNVSQAAQFFSLSHVATVKLNEIENQLNRGDMSSRHGYLANAIVDISAVALHCGRSLLARIGKNIPAAKGLETALTALEDKCNKLERMCTARYGKAEKPGETATKLLDNIYKFNSWLTQVAEAVLNVNFDSGSNLQTAQDFQELHQNLVNDLKVKITEVGTLDRIVTELAGSSVEADVTASKDAATKIKALNEQYAKVNVTAEQRLKLATDLVAFHKRVQQLSTHMDQLELHLKLEKLDPSNVPESSVTFKADTFKKMSSEWTDVETKGKQFVNDCKELVSDDNSDLERTVASVEFLLAHLSDRKSILSEFFERWKGHVSSGLQFKTEWQQFKKDARQTIDWIMKVENDFFPEIAGELGTNSTHVKTHMKRLEDFKPTIVKAKDEVEKHLKTAELLSMKGDTHGQRDQVVNDLLKVHTRFLARVGEYRFLLNMADKFFENLNQLDDLIKKTEKQYANEELPKEVAAAQTALREHYESRAGLEQFIDFASEEADQIVIRVRQQDSEALARDEVQRILKMAEEKRNAWDKAWQDQKNRLDQNFQACQFYFDLKQLQNELDELQRQLDLRRGNYGSSMTSADMIVKAFHTFLTLADAVEGRMREFMGTADRMVRDKHYDSRRIRHEVDETDRRWKTFYNSIKNYELALADSVKFYKSWEECEHWINEAAQFLLGISREAPHCQTTEDVDRLIKKIETYRMEGYKEQDGRLNGMERIATDLYGSVIGPEKLQPLLDKNQEMFNAFVRAVEELAILRNNLNKTEQILAQVGAVLEQKTPRQPRFVQSLQNAEISEGHGVTFECRLECDSSAPLVEWLKDGLPMSRGTTVYKDGLCQLTIDITNAGDSGTYSCKATTAGGFIETMATLKVKEAQLKVTAPAVASQLKSVDAPEGTSLTLECYLTGTPYPKVTWFKDGVEIVESPDYSMTVGNNSGEPCTLRIKRLNQAVHSGVYTVKAVNAGGNVSSEATVNVISIQKPEFIEPLKDQFVQEGKGTRLECKYVGEPAPQIQWLLNDTQILPSALFKITVDVGTASLEMREVFAEDCGIYSCVAKNLGGEARTTCRVGLLEASLSESAAARAGARRPVRPQFITPLDDLIVQEGNRIKLECVVTGYPEAEIQWIHNGSPVRKSKDVDTFFDNGNCSLVIYEVYLEDAGEYVCVAKNEHGSTQTSCRLIVEPLGDLSDASASATGDVPPKFTQLLKDIEGTEGELVRFECRVIGHPTPVIKWFRGRTQIENSPEFQILSERELQALTIPMLCKEDAGNYMVKANNDAGQAKCYATLIVKPASDRTAMKLRLIESCHSVQTSVIDGCTAPVITRSFRDLHARPGNPCTMEVVIEGTPKPKVQWLFNNELITSNEYQITSFGDVHSLHIANVTDKDAGRFSVIAENVAGKAWCSALLVVVEASQLMWDEEEPPETPLVAATAPPTMMAKPIPPRFSEPLKNFTVEEGSPVALECRIVGEPEPLIRWYKEGRPLTHGPGFDIRKNGDRASLTMYSVSEKDSGRYTCIAQNPAGENSSSSTLIVNAPNAVPQFLEKPRSQRVREGQPARFVARASGRPAPVVTWFREGVPIVSSPDFAINVNGDVHSLDIAEVFVEDAGKFTVQLSNIAGQEQHVFDLSVEPTAVKKETATPVVPPQFTRPLSNQRATVGQRVTLECAIAPYTQPDQVNWYRNEVFLELSPDCQQSYRDGVCQLTIPVVGTNHAGRYTCVILLKGVSNSTDMYLEVVAPEPEAAPPHFDDKMRSVELQEAGHDAIFVCHVTGRPTPHIQWYHEDYPLKPSKKHDIKQTKDGVCSLRVRTVTADDIGRYTCVATNPTGQQTCYAELNLEGAGGVDESSYVSQDTLRRLMASPGRLRDGEYGGVSEHYFKPVFRKVPADLEVPEGQLARFDCVVVGRPTPDVLWFRDGTEVLEDRLHKIVINEEGISSLIIDATSIRDAGLYTCIARNRGGEDRFQVRLNILPRQTSSPPRFLSRLANQTVQVGQSVTFEAEVSGVPIPMLSWQKDNNHIMSSDRYKIHTEGCRSTLFIPSVRADDDAWYQCTAASVSGTATNRVRLVVQVEAKPTPVQRPPSAQKLFVTATPPPSRASPYMEGLSRVETVSRTQTISPAVVHIDASGIPAPRLVEPMRDQHLNDGAMAHFWCKVYSQTPPTCQWYHDNQPLTLSDKHRIANNPRDGDYALMVFDVRPRDAGVYKCVVGNQGGEVTCIAHLHVESLRGQTSRVSHTGSGSGEPIVVEAPETAISQTWTQQQHTAVQQAASQPPQPKVTPSEPPRFSKPLSDVTAADGSEVVLSCVVSGQPAPSVSWFHNDRNIDRSTDFAITYDDRTGRSELVIVDCMTDDRGQFRCVATNSAGRAETVCNLNVLGAQPAPASLAEAQKLMDVDMSEEFRTAAAQLQQASAPAPAGSVEAQVPGQAPKFVQPIQPCVVVEGDSCTFSAIITGDPSPDVVWLKEKQDLALTERHSVAHDPATGKCSLTIRACNSSDTGVYSCRASNASGRATCTANVVVVPPNVEVTVTDKTTSVKKEKVTVVGDQETRVVENSPTFTESLQPVTEVAEGSNVRLECRFSAEPAPSVIWRFNGSVLQSDNRVTLAADSSHATLAINGATLADTGEYVCTATNALGEASTKTFLRVRKLEADVVPPLPSVQPSSAPLSSDLPLPTQAVTSGSAFEVSLPLRMPVVPLVDPCTIIAKPQAQRIQQPPKFNRALHNQAVNDGDSALFTVQYEGTPRPSISWFFNGRPVTTDRHKITVNNDELSGISSLTVTNATAANDGEYVCKAVNASGTAFTTSHLFVLARSPVDERRPNIDTTTTQMISACTHHPKVASTVGQGALFSTKIQAERHQLHPIRTDASHCIPASNVFIPISVAEKHGIAGDQLASAFAQAKIFEGPSGGKSIRFPVPVFQLCQTPSQIFSETVAIDTGDHHRKLQQQLIGQLAELELRKLKISTLAVQQPAMPQCYRLEAHINRPQTFSETVAIDTSDHKPYEIELLKKKTSLMDVERKAMPKGLRMEAEILPAASKLQTVVIYVARSKCIEAIREHREELLLNLEGGAAPIFTEKLQSTMQTMDGSRVTLACKVAARPMPEEVLWYRDGRPIYADNPDFTCTYDAKTGHATLSINDVFPEDAGLFECVAENMYGKANTQAELFVEAYEYIPDSEESLATQSLSSLSLASALEDYAKTVAEALVEETCVIERGYEERIQIADVKWCLKESIAPPMETEVAAEFQLEALESTDGRNLVEECRGVELAKPRVAGKTQAMVSAQLAQFTEEQLSSAVVESANSATQEVVVDRDLVRQVNKGVGQTFAREEKIVESFDETTAETPKTVDAEDRAAENLTSPLETPPGKSHPACWTFPIVSMEAAEMPVNELTERVPTPQNVQEDSVDAEHLERSSAKILHTHVGAVVEYQSEGEEEDLFVEAAEAGAPAKPIDADKMSQATVWNRQCALTSTLTVYIDEESASAGLEAITGETPQPTETTVALSSPPAVLHPAQSRAVMQLEIGPSQVVDPLSFDALTDAAFGNESVIAEDLEPARSGRAKPVQAAPQIELIAIDKTTDYEVKLDLELPSEKEVANEFVTSSKEIRPLTKVKAVIELVPQEKMQQAGDDTKLPEEFGVESTVSNDHLQQSPDRNGLIARVKQQTEVTGTEKTGDLSDAELNVYDPVSSTIPDEMQPTSDVFGVPLTHVVSCFDRTSPERINDLELDLEVLSTLPSDTERFPLARPHVSETIVKDPEPIFEEMLAPIVRQVERELPQNFQLPIPEEYPVDVSCETTADAVDSQQPEIVDPETVFVELNAANVDICTIILDEITVEEIVIHLKRKVERDANDYVACEENSPETIEEFEDETMAVVPDVSELHRVSVNDCKIISEETVLEEIFITVVQNKAEAPIEDEMAPPTRAEPVCEEPMDMMKVPPVETPQSIAEPVCEEPMDMMKVPPVETPLSMSTYPETVSLPQTVTHHVEATCRLSPVPSITNAVETTIKRPSLGEIDFVDEWTVYQQEEETFNEVVCEEKIDFLQNINVCAERQEPPVFTVPLKNVKVIDGHEITIECHVTGVPRPDVKWSVDGIDVHESADFRLTYEGTRCALKIADVLPEDEGQYKVTATNVAGTCSTSAYVTVDREKPDERQRHSSGEELYSSGEETMTTWTVESNQVFEEFKNVEIDVSLRRSEVSVTEQQVPGEAPQFVRQLESIDVFEGTPVKLECDVRGFPQPEITWYQDGKKISPDDHVKLAYSNGRCELTIDKVNIDDEAEYMCEAKNEHGTVTTWAELLVEKLIEGLEQFVIEEFYEVEIEMNFKWKDKRPATPPRDQATIM